MKVITNFFIFIVIIILLCFFIIFYEYINIEKFQTYKYMELEIEFDNLEIFYQYQSTAGLSDYGINLLSINTVAPQVISVNDETNYKLYEEFKISFISDKIKDIDSIIKNLFNNKLLNIIEYKLYNTYNIKIESIENLAIDTNIDTNIGTEISIIIKKLYYNTYNNKPILNIKELESEIPSIIDAILDDLKNYIYKNVFIDSKFTHIQCGFEPDTTINTNLFCELNEKTVSLKISWNKPSINNNILNTKTKLINLIPNKQCNTTEQCKVKEKSELINTEYLNFKEIVINLLNKLNTYYIILFEKKINSEFIINTKIFIFNNTDDMVSFFIYKLKDKRNYEIYILYKIYNTDFIFQSKSSSKNIDFENPKNNCLLNNLYTNRIYCNSFKNVLTYDENIENSKEIILRNIKNKIFENKKNLVIDKNNLIINLL